MEFKWLEDFVTLAKMGSFSRSARERNVTQPAFGRRIRALEHWCGATLVDRSTYPLSLTPAGQRFYESATQILQRISQERAELLGQCEEGLPVSFSAPHSLATYFFPHLLERVESSLGEICTRMTADNLHDCVDSLIHSGCDFLITFRCNQLPLVLDPERFQSLTLVQDRLVPVSAPSAADVAAYVLPRRGDVLAPVLSYTSDSYLGHALSILLSSRRAVLRKVVYENALTEALRVMALSRRGIAWLPEHCVALELEAQKLVLAGGPKWQVPLEIRIYRSATNRKPIVERIWQVCKQSYSPAYAC